MNTTNKKLQLKKETMAVLNDKSLFAINGGNNPNEEDGMGPVTLGTCVDPVCRPITREICVTKIGQTCFQCPPEEPITSFTCYC